MIENTTVQPDFVKTAYKSSKWGGGREMYFQWLSELQDKKDLTLKAT